MTRSVGSVWEQSQAAVSGSGCGFSLIREAPQIDAFSIYDNGRLPFLSVLVPYDTTVLRRRARKALSILRVSTVRNDTKIGSAAIQAIPIAVISIESITLGQTQDCPMEFDRVLVAVEARRSIRIPISVELPTPVSQDRRVAGIDDGVGSDRAVLSAQGDENGILSVHRGDLQVSSVTGPGRSSGAGSLRVNCTI